MDTLQWQHKYKDFKDFLFRLLNKEFLIFLFFLAITTAFWFLTALNNPYERELKVPLRMVDVPENIVITEALPDSVRVTIKDKGFNVIKYSWEDNVPSLQLPFKTYVKSKDKGSVTPTELQKLLKGQLDETTAITSVKAEHWDFFFCHGSRKRVPVLINGFISPKSNYYISRSSLRPDSITVLAEPEALDTIRAVYTEVINLSDVSESSTRDVSLQHIKGAKLESGRASLSIITDQLTEVTVKVPIRTVNVPEGVSLKTFPGHVDVRVAVGVRSSSAAKPELFNVTADYNDLPNDPKEKLHLRIVSQPRGIIKATLQVPAVDYLIENDNLTPAK